MPDQLLLQTGSFEGLRETGSVGRPLHTLYPQLKAVIEAELDQTAALLFAEPVVDEQRRRIDWYTQGTGKPIALTDLPEGERESGYAQLVATYDRIQALADRYRSSDDSDRMQLGTALRAALAPPAAANIFLVDDHPIITYWGFFPEPSWGELIDLPRLRDGLNVQPTPEPGDALSAEPNSVMPPALVPPELPEIPAVSQPLQPQKPPALPVMEIEKPEPVLVKLFVVVGSKLFWSTVIIAVLLLVLAAVLNYLIRVPDANQITAVTGANSVALLDARSREIELRARLNQLLQDFNEQRLQCADCGSEAQTLAPTPKTGTMDSTEPAMIGEAGMMEKAESTPLGITNGTKSAVAEAAESLPESQGSLTETLESALSKTDMPESTAATPPEPDTSPAVETVPEPTAEESQEFTDRLATEGGKVGEITVTLLWNNRNDLDLVVICPNGERLYYNTPTVCGGALDVDRNAGKQLMDRPVENIHWPQGQAAAGTYRVAVKYYARKDGNAPPVTPFQVRLLRNDQEQIFKGMVVPDELKSVTDFTVEP
ncbi:MAG: hypothetical protein HC808_01660 [Candidatus Competibacteraceae bacterium]|nr:hypothetical protein [Candidatus Competibacteraceae bacterium]